MNSDEGEEAHILAVVLASFSASSAAIEVHHDMDGTIRCCLLGGHLDGVIPKLPASRQGTRPSSPHGRRRGLTTVLTSRDKY